MKYRNRFVKRILKTVVAVLLCILVTQRFWGYEMMAVCEAKANQDEDAIEQYIKGYYGAYEKGNLDCLKEYITDEEALKRETAVTKALYKCGFVKYDHIDVLVEPLSDGRHWLAFASIDMVVEGLDVDLPGARSFIVGKNRDGTIYLAEDDASDNLNQDILLEIREAMELEEIEERMLSIAAEYNDMVAENPEVADWIQKAMDVKSKAVIGDNPDLLYVGLY